MERNRFRRFRKPDCHRKRLIFIYPGRARAIDNRLHDLIASSCGNPFLRDELDRLKLLYRFFRDVAFEQDGPFNNYFRKDKEAREHLAIVEALQAGDTRLASRAMSRHILSALRYFEDLTRHIQAEKSRGRMVGPVGIDQERRNLVRRTLSGGIPPDRDRRSGHWTPGGEFMVTHLNRAIRATLVMIATAIGLAGMPLGCGGSTGSSSQGGVEKVPESVNLMKNAMKERAAAQKGRKGGAPGKR
jgi:hypothetical protein